MVFLRKSLELKLLTYLDPSTTASKTATPGPPVFDMIRSRG